MDGTPVPRAPQLQTLIADAEEELSQLHDRIDLLFDRTDGVRVTRPTDPPTTGVDESFGAYHLDSLGRLRSGIQWASARLERLLSELEV